MGCVEKQGRLMRFVAGAILFQRGEWRVHHRIKVMEFERTKG